MNFLAPINEQVVELCKNRQILTPNDRLAKEFTNSYDQYQLSKGKSAWESPNVHSFSSHLKAKFSAQMLTLQDPIELISRRQLFTRLFAIVPRNQRSLINQAIDAIDLIYKFEVDIDQFSSLSFKCGRLIEWLKTAVEDCKKPYLLESEIASFLANTKIEPQKPLALYQFDLLPPVEQNYLNNHKSEEPVVLINSNTIKGLIPNAKEITITPTPTPTPTKVSQTVLKCNSFEEEVSQATKWAMSVKSVDSDSIIGIVVPNLTNRYNLISRQIANSLDPEKGSHTDRFNISSGQSLDKHPIWTHALVFLRACNEHLTLEEYAILSNSKFFDSDDLTDFLRESQPKLASTFPPKPLPTTKNSMTLFEFLEEQKSKPQQRSLADWVTTLRSWLALVNWPCLDRLQTFEFQAYQAIKKEFTFLEGDNLTKSLDYDSALQLIHGALENTLHAPERQAQDIQVLGIIESIGLAFTHLWVCEMDENNFPSKSSYNPFLPLSIKKQYGMPRADQESELEFSKTLLLNWTGNSREINYSFNCEQNDSRVSKSPLLRHLEESTVDLKISGFHPWYGNQSQKLVETLDIRGPKFADHSISSGLTMLKDQLNCAFKAFAVHRLGLTQKQLTTNFPQPFEKGIVVHEILAKLLSKSRTQDDVTNISQEQIQEVTSSIVHRKFQEAPRTLRSSEIKRISNIIQKWIELEAKRKPFEIIGLEKPFKIQLGGIEFSIRADRIDKLEEGLVLLDYKTGRVNLSQTRADNLKEPQLATYALAIEGLRGTFYAQLNDEESIKVSGILDQKMEFGDMMASSASCDWDKERASWAVRINEAVQNFIEGRADISPTKEYCTHCHLAGLCRIQ
ncbi:PD-(D/E)XK nuclease family protein [Gammaproteobacteria bacterium]|nr:PD-(D/E)XK nuclease family protein [Gammaproteobacteria bacterium]